MPSPKEGKLLYHLTHLNNMESIIRRGLMSRNALHGEFVDTADPEIIAHRHEYTVDLSNYVPFHFFVRNPYDGAVCKKHGAENMAIIAIFRPKDNAPGYYVVPNHPLSGSPEFLPYQEGFEKVNWDLLDHNSRDRNYADPVVRHACMAECDVDRVIPASEFCFVYVKTEAGRDRILKMAGADQIQNKLRVSPHMFP